MRVFPKLPNVLHSEGRLLAVGQWCQLQLCTTYKNTAPLPVDEEVRKVLRLTAVTLSQAIHVAAPRVHAEQVNTADDFWSNYFTQPYARELLTWQTLWRS